MKLVLKKIVEAVINSSFFYKFFFGTVLLAMLFGYHQVFSPIFALHAITNFGKTHFIIGYDGKDSLPKTKINVPPTESSLTIPTSLAELNKKYGCSVLFSPDDNMHEALLYLIDNEQEHIALAIFTFTDGTIAQALQNAQMRGIKIDLVTDRSGLSEQYNKIDGLSHQGIQVFVYNPSLYQNKKKNGIMHHKFIIFKKNIHDKPVVWTGSYNLTKSARFHNHENVVVTNKKSVINKFERHFELLCQRSNRYTPPVFN